MMSRTYLGLRTYCIVTGASQGIGSKIAVELAQKFDTGSVMVLLARSLHGLNKTKELISEANKGVSVLTSSVDLSKADADEFSRIIKESLEGFGLTVSKFASCMLVHNAGSLGDIQQYCSDMSDVQKIAQYFSLNLFSVMCLTSVFLKLFTHEKVQNRLVINVTSLCAIKPFKSLGYYCIGKASREMYFNVLAEEETNLSVLSYSPGPVNTEMVSNIMQNVRDPEVKDLFLSMKESEKILTTSETVQRLIGILAKGQFKSGCRIDYFDSSD